MGIRVAHAESVRRQAATRMQRDCNAKAMSQQTVCGVCSALTEDEGDRGPKQTQTRMNRIFNSLSVPFQLVGKNNDDVTILFELITGTVSCC